MAAILVLYATQEGQTKNIADFIGEVLKDEGHKVAVASVEHPPTLAPFDAFVLGASIHVGHYPQVFHDYVKTYNSSFNKGSSAMFSVCLAANKDDTDHMQKAQAYINELTAETAWKPDQSISFAGAIRFTQYGFFKKQVMKAIAKKEHLKVDAKHDFEYTDWERVTRFALEFSKLVKSRQRTTASARPVSPAPLSKDANSL